MGKFAKFHPKMASRMGVKLTDHFTITDENDNLNVENLVSKKAGFGDPGQRISQRVLSKRSDLL